MRYLIFILVIAFGSRVLAQTNNTCAGAAPFCSGSASQYPATSTGGSALPPGSYIGCLGSAPYPAFFIIPITASGSLTLGISAQSDVDFIAFGPFHGPSSAGGGVPGGYCNNLNAQHVVPNVPGSSNGCSYSGSPTETLIVPNAVVGDFYVLIVTNFSQQSQQITVTPNGSSAIGGMVVTGTSELCAGRTATANVAPGTNIQSVTWSDATGIIGSNYTQSFPNMQATTIFTITGLSITGQNCTATHKVIVDPTPTAAIVNNGPLCDGDPLSFTVTGATSYNWSGPNFFSQSGIGTTSTSPTVFGIPVSQVANTGTYSVLATLNTCTSIATNYVLVKPNPTVTVSKGGDFCLGKSFSLLSNGATTYTWTGPNSFNFQGQNPLFLNNTLNMSGTYSVIGKTNGCKSSTTLSVTVNPLPNIMAFSSGSVCQSSSITLSASGGSTYVWTGPSNYISHQATVNINSAAPANTGTYLVTGTDANGCVNTSTVFQLVRPTPFVNIYSADACITKNLLLTAEGGANYQWDGPAYFSSGAQNPVITNANEANSGVYNVTVTSTYGCVQTASVQATVYRNPVIDVLGSREACSDKAFYFTASGAINYKWLNSTGIVTELPTFTIAANSPALQKTYTLVGTDGHFCSGFIPFYPIVNQKPLASIIPDIEKNCAPFCTNIDLNILTANVNTYKWAFSDGSTSPGQTGHFTKCFNTPGITTLSVTLTDSKSCTNVITKTVQAYVSPKADFVYTPDKPTENDNVVTFSDASSNADVASWSWNFYLNDRGTQKDTSVKQSVTLTYKDVGNYLVYLKVTAANGCTDSISKILVLADDPAFFIPNAFTPNGDGLNDVFVPKSVAVSIYEMQVFNRWGHLLFSTTDPTKGWDGKASGSDVLPTDTYIYKFSVTGYDKNPKIYTGQFSLIK